MRVTVIATGFYLNKERKFGSREDEAAGKAEARRFVARSDAAPTRERLPSAAEAPGKEDDGDSPSTWREDLDYPAILRKKMA